MTEDQQFFGNNNFTATFGQEGPAMMRLDLFSGRWQVEAGYIHCSSFAEQGALTQKMRLHQTVDMLECSVNSMRRIPFGTEFTVKRTIDMIDGIGRMALDVLPEAGGAITSLELEPVTVTGSFRRVGVLEAGAADYRWHELAEASQIVYDRSEVPLMVTLEGTSGERFDFGCGDDLWRHLAGSREGCNGQSTVRCSSRKMTLTRKLFDLPVELAERKRAWRVKSFFAWSDGKKKKSAPAREIRLADEVQGEQARRVDAEGNTTAALCLESKVVRRKMRELVRGNSESLRFRDITPGVCFAAGHLERPGKQLLMHWDVSDCIEFFIWANHQMAKNGLFAELAPGASFAEESALFQATENTPLMPITEYNP